MSKMIVNNQEVSFTDEKNILTVLRKNGIQLPTLCYYPDLQVRGACRLCVVEDDKGRTFAACSEPPREGMVIFTHTMRLKKYRRLILELLLSAHCRDCTSCNKCSECKLQLLARDLGVSTVRFEDNRPKVEIDASSPSIIRDPNKCILCGDCVRVCQEIQGIGILDFAYRGSNSRVIPAFNKKLTETKCVSCGQCRVYCPTGAITINPQIDKVFTALQNPNLRVVAQIAPAVRVAVGEAFGLPAGINAMNKIVAALHKIGFQKVFDTTYTADLTILEESAEFLERVKNGGKLPLLTSCCPAWVKFVETQFPEFKPNVSTTRSPQAMFSAILKEYYRDPENAQGKDTYVVSIMPCTAKKMEAERPESYTKGQKDTDAVLTTEELIYLLRSCGIDFASLAEEEIDMPFGIGSGAGVIFGVTGGVTEAVLRHLTNTDDPAALKAIAESGVRGQGIKEFVVPYNGINVSICVASGLANARKVLEQVRSGEKQYHLIEIMACPGGCVMGGGQPVTAQLDRKTVRTEGLYSSDNSTELKRSGANPLMKLFYEGCFQGKAHELCHVPHID